MAVPQDLKRIFVTEIRDKITRIVQDVDDLEDMIDQFLILGFKAGGTDPITDADLLNIGTNVADLAKGKALVDNLIKFIDNDGPVAANYRETFDLLRTDFGLTRRD
jgi:hypothetical protein